MQTLILSILIAFFPLAALASADRNVVADTFSSSDGTIGWTLPRSSPGALASSVNPTFTGVVTAPTFAGNLSGVAAQCTRFAATPSGCAPGSGSRGIDDQGNSVCQQVVNQLSASLPMLVSGGSTPNITIQKASLSQDGYLSAVDFAMFATGGGGGGGGTWGSITGTLSSQLDLQAALDAKEPLITAGTTSQYYRGDKSFQTLDTSVVPENGNLYFTNGRFDARLATKSTTDLAEGSNLYYTDVRARNAISGTAPVAYDNTTGVISMPQADTTSNGFLNHSDWNTFNGKQDVGLSFLKGGNTGLTNGDFMGSSDDNDVTFKRNSVESFRLQTGALRTNQPIVARNTGFGAAAPAYAFEETGNDTGLFSGGDGEIDFSNNAAIGMSLDASHNLAVVGTVTAPTLLGAVIAPSVTTPLIQAPAASDLSIVTDNGTQVTYSAFGGSNSIVNEIPVDNVSKDEWKSQVNVTPPANMTNASNSVRNDSMDWGGGGAFGTTGQVVGNRTGVGINSSGFVNGYTSVYSGNMNFAGGGHANLFKGLDMSAAISTGYTVDNYNGVFSSLNSTGGIFDSLTLFGGGAGFDGVTGNNFQGMNFNYNITGASVFTGGYQAYGSGINLGGTSTMANNIQGGTTQIRVLDSAHANGGVIGSNANIVIQDNATSNNINGAEIDIDAQDAAVVSGANVISSNLQIHNTASVGNANGLATGLNMDGSSTITGYNGANVNALVSGSAIISNGVNIFSGSSNINGNAIMSNHQGLSMPLSVGGSAQITGNYEGLFLSPFLTGAASTNNLIVADLSTHLDNTATVAGQWAGLKIDMQTNGGNTFNGTGDLQGIEVNMSGANLSAAKKAAGAQKAGLKIEDGTVNAQYDWTMPGNTFFGNVHNFGGNVHVAAGDPVVNALTFGIQQGMGFDFQDDYGPDFTTLRLGFISVGTVAQVGGAAGKTADAVTINLAAMSNQSGAGTIDKGVGYASMGFLPSGGTLAVNNFYAFEAGPAICAIVGNCWAFHDKSGGAENFLGKLAIGTSTEKVANSSTALEIGNNKAFLNGRGTTAQRNALTAVAGMQFFDTTLNQLFWHDGTVWVLATGTGGGTVTAVTATAPILSSGGATPDISIPASTNAVDGYLTAADHTTFAAKFDTPAGTTSQYVRGDGSIATLDTSVVPENTNLYYTAARFNTAFAVKTTDDLTEGASNLYFLNARAISAPLTGFSAAAGTVAATDSILQGFNKVVGNIALKAPLANPTFSGTVTGTFSGNLTGNVTGNADTATALAANPTDCAGGQFASAIDAHGNLTCSTPAGTGVTSVSGTAPVVSSGGATPAISMAASTNAVDGYLTAADHTTFAAKVSATRAINTTAPITGGGDLSADRTLAMAASTNAVDGYLTAADHTTFAAKQAAFTPVSGETPSGTIDNSNVTFTLAHTPLSGTLHVYLDGLRTTDFTLATATITMTTAPKFGQTLTADYSF